MKTTITTRTLEYDAAGRLVKETVTVEDSGSDAAPTPSYLPPSRAAGWVKDYRTLPNAIAVNAGEIASPYL